MFLSELQLDPDQDENQTEETRAAQEDDFGSRPLAARHVGDEGDTGECEPCSSDIHTGRARRTHVFSQYLSAPVRPILPQGGYVTVWSRHRSPGYASAMPGPRSPFSERLDPFASESRVRELVEQLPCVVYVDTDDQRPSTIYISPNIEQLLGFPAQRFLDDHGLWIRSMHPDDRERIQGLRDEVWSTGARYRSEYRMFRQDGEEVWLRDSSVLVLSEEGQRLAWQGVIEDITSERRAEQEIRASEARYRALVERVPAVVYEMGPDDERRTLFVSPHVEQVLGYSRAEWLDQPDIWIELLHADDREVVLEQHDRHSETGEPWDLEYRLIASDGRVVWVHDRAILMRGRDRGAVAWHGVMIDITAEHDFKEMLLLQQEDLERRVDERTNELQEANELMALEIGERRRMENELRQVEERYRRLVEDMPGIAYIWEIDPGAKIRSFGYVSPRVQDVLGFSPDEWRAAARIHPHDQARVGEALDRSRTTGESFLMEYRFLAKDGSVVWVLDHASLISRAESGDPANFQGVMLDITPWKDAESKAEAAEDRFRTLAERGPAVIYSFELAYDGDDAPPSVRVPYVSPQAAELVRYPIDRWLEKPEVWLEMIHPDDRERLARATENNLRTAEPWSIRYRMIRSDGAVIWLLDAGRMIERDPLGRPWRFQGLLLDVTEDEDARSRLESSERSQRHALEGALAIPWTEEIHPETGFERYTYIGPQAFDILGYTPEELMVERKHFPRMVHPDDRARVRDAVVLSEETGLWEDTYRVLRRDGKIRWLHSLSRRSSPPGAVPEVWQGVTIDVTASRAKLETPSEIGDDAQAEPSFTADPTAARGR
jgi:PAS domain S-box-containing protein